MSVSVRFASQPNTSITRPPVIARGAAPRRSYDRGQCLPDEIAAPPAAARNDICFEVGGTSSKRPRISVAVVSPCWASPFSLRAQRKETKRKGTRRERRLRRSPADLPCSGPGQSGSCRGGPERDIVSRSPLRSSDRPAPSNGTKSHSDRTGTLFAPGPRIDEVPRETSASCTRQSVRLALHPLKHHRNPLPAADTHGGQCVAPPGAVQFVNGLGGDDDAGRAHRVTQ